MKLPRRHPKVPKIAIFKTLQFCQLYFFSKFFSTIFRAKNFTSPLYYNFATEIIAEAMIGAK